MVHTDFPIKYLFRESSLLLNEGKSAHKVNRMEWLSTIQLKGKFVTLEPLHTRHVEGLKLAVLNGEPWKLWFASVPSPEAMETYVEQAVLTAKSGNIAFAVRCNKTNEIVGTSRFYNVDSKTNARCWDIHGIHHQ